MKPASTTRSGRWRSISAASAASNSSREACSAWATTAVGMPWARAVSSPLASALLLITAAMRQGSFAASMACMLLPRPEMRMTMDFIRI